MEILDSDIEERDLGAQYIQGRKSFLWGFSAFILAAINYGFAVLFEEPWFLVPIIASLCSCSALCIRGIIQMGSFDISRKTEKGSYKLIYLGNLLFGIIIPKAITVYVIVLLNALSGIS